MPNPPRSRTPARHGRARIQDPAKRKPRSRALRRQATDAERLLWSHLRGRSLLGRKFRRQVPIGPYIVDFLCIQDRLIVEADGGQHAGQGPYDSRRTAELQARGYRVLRFWNNDILAEPDAVLEEIRRVLEGSG